MHFQWAITGSCHTVDEHEINFGKPGHFVYQLIKIVDRGAFENVRLDFDGLLGKYSSGSRQLRLPRVARQHV